MKNVPKRPRSLTLVLVLLILLGLIQAAKVVALREQSALLLDLQVRPDPRLRMIIAAVWMIIFWIMAIALWRRIALTRWLVPLVIVMHVVYELAILWLYAQVPISNERWFLYCFVTAVMVSFCAWALNRSANKFYFLEVKPAGE
jgi:hypothetical protein